MPGPATVTIHDPADGSPVGELRLATPEEVEAAVGSAAARAVEWARTDPTERAAAVLACADRLAEAADDLALMTTREMGKPLADARGGVLR